MSPSVETDAILSRLRQEFIETSVDFLDSIDASLVAIADDSIDSSSEIEELQRVIHTIKGQGTTFDFPAVTRIAHRMEDYMESAMTWNAETGRGLAKFSDALRDILESGANPNDAELRSILGHLPVSSQEVLADQDQRVVRALLVMPQSMQRKLVAQELAACGFHVMTASTPVKAIGAAVATPPNIILATEVMEEMNGHELLCVFAQIDKTKDCRLALMTSQPAGRAGEETLPAGTVVLHKSGGFHEDLGKYLMEQGLFGKITRQET